MHAFGHSTAFSEVVNPCLGVIENTKATTWETIGPHDLAKLHIACSGIERGLLLWLPLRHDDILPAPKLTFIDNRPQIEDLISGFIENRAELHLTLAGLRHLNRIELWQDTTQIVGLRRAPDAQRMRGFDPAGELRSLGFRGTITDQGAEASTYVGREVSVNDQWGVFSRARVQLLPHQLWVCRQVTRAWPIRWLVADDVGLGKTIEAGLILEPLIASGRVRRVLVLAPARLVPQWRARMKTMFEIRLQEFTADSDRGRISFWETAHQVVASFHTLRMDKPRKRLLQAEPWDLVIVDEAHHFQAQERAATLTYGLLRELEDAGRIASLVLFTGTPHRGKDFGFLALMQLLRPDLFDPEKEMEEQLSALPNAMIRNNKALVTDLDGNKLFRPVVTRAIDYGYSEAEAAFYHTMSEFILDGRAYAAMSRPGFAGGSNS